MYKKQLLSLQTLNATMNIEETLVKDKPYKIQKGWGGGSAKAYEFYWFYRAKTHLIGDIKVLQVSVFTRRDLEINEKVPRYRLFMWEHKYLTFDTITETWKTGMIDKLSYGEYIDYGIPINQYCEEKDRKVIINFTNNKYESPYAAINNWQSENKNMKELDLIDHDMNLVPALPRNFDKWITETAMLESRYIYYEYSKRVTKGYCTHCKQEVPIENPKYNQKGICPRCKSNITFKTKKKQGYSTEDTGYATLIQKTKEGYVTRYFEIRRNFSDYKNPTGGYWELIRTIYAKDFKTWREYEWAKFHGTQIMRWCNKDGHRWNEINVEHRSVVYEKNLDKIFSGSSLQYCAYDKFTKQNLGYKHYPHSFLASSIKKPCIEYFIKMGLHQLVKEIIQDKHIDYINTRGRNIKEIFDLPKEQINQLIRIKGNGRAYEILKEAQECNIRLEDEHLLFLKENDHRRNMSIYIRHTTPHKMIKYLKSQGENFNCSDYHDYLQMAARLKYELKNEFLLFPKHFEQAHDALVEEEKEALEALEAKKKKEESKNNRLIKKLAKQYMEQFYLENEKYIIRPAVSATELRVEGQTLHHCVAGYAKSVAEGKTIILVIRKKEEPETPFFTMEVNRGQVMQVRGKHNCAPPAAVNKVVNKFKREKLVAKQERKVS